MHFFTSLFTFFTLALVAFAAPLPVKRGTSTSTSTTTTSAPTSTASSTSSSGDTDVMAQLQAAITEQLITYGFRTEAIADIDSNCGNNTQSIIVGLSAAQLVASEAQNVTADDPVFQVFFQSKDVSSVQKMFKAIASFGGAQPASKQFKVTCPANGAFNFAKNVYASTNGTQTPQQLPQITLSPAMFNTSSNSSSDDFSNALVLGYTLLQELTHLDAYASAAGLPKNQSCGGNTTTSGTCDISSQQDQQNPGQTYSDRLSTGLELALCLRSRWDTYNQQGGQAPPVTTLMNAGSYPPFASVYFLTKKAASIPQANGLMMMMLMGLQMMKANQC